MAPCWNNKLYKHKNLNFLRKLFQGYILNTFLEIQALKGYIDVFGINLSCTCKISKRFLNFFAKLLITRKKTLKYLLFHFTWILSRTKRANIFGAILNQPAQVWFQKGSSMSPLLINLWDLKQDGSFVLIFVDEGFYLVTF